MDLAFIKGVCDIISINIEYLANVINFKLRKSNLKIRETIQLIFSNFHKLNMTFRVMHFNHKQRQQLST